MNDTRHDTDSHFGESERGLNWCGKMVSHNLFGVLRKRRVCTEKIFQGHLGESDSFTHSVVGHERITSTSEETGRLSAFLGAKRFHASAK